MGAIVLNDDETAQNWLLFRMPAGLYRVHRTAFWCCGVSKRCHSDATALRERDESSSVLQQHPKVSQVYYPGLESPRWARAGKEADAGFRRYVIVELKGDSMPEAVHVMESFEVFSLGESLGGVRITLHPSGEHDPRQYSERRT